MIEHLSLLAVPGFGEIEGVLMPNKFPSMEKKKKSHLTPLKISLAWRKPAVSRRHKRIGKVLSVENFSLEYGDNFWIDMDFNFLRIFQVFSPKT
jgi:hypothetical protein